MDYCAHHRVRDHERRAMSTDHRLDSAWFGAGAAIKQRGLEQALRMVKKTTIIQFYLSHFH
jgi:hypothetical protein